MRTPPPARPAGSHPRPRPLPPLQGYRKAASLAIARLNEIAVSFAETSAGRRTMLEKCAKTALNSKLISQYQVRTRAGDEGRKKREAKRAHAALCPRSLRAAFRPLLALYAPSPRRPVSRSRSPLTLAPPAYQHPHPRRTSLRP